jgi:hypothetical protein
MAAAIQDYSATPASNNASPPVGAPENHLRSDVNNIAREIMASLRADWEGSAVGGGVWRNPILGETVTRSADTVLLISGIDATAFFPTGRKVKVSRSDAGNPVYAFIASSSFGAPDTTVNLEDFDDVAPDNVLHASTNKVEFFCGFGGSTEHGLGKSAFEGIGFGKFEVPQADTAAGIQSAITTAVADGKIVLLEEVTYALEATVTIPSNCRMWGMGPERSIGKLDNALNIPCFQLDVGADNIELRGFSIDGNAAEQSTDGIGIEGQGGHTRVNLKDLYIHDTYTHGIEMGGADDRSVWIENLRVDSPGGHGIHLFSTGVAQFDIFIDRVSVYRWGHTGGAGTTNADGIRVEETATLSNIQIEPDQPAAHTGGGINLLEVASGGLGGASRCALSNFGVVGTGADCKGLIVGGRFNKVSNGVIDLLTAAGTNLPLLVDGFGAGADTARDNSFSNVYFGGGSRCDIQADAERTEFHGCHFEGQSTQGIRQAGIDTLIKDCSFVGQTGDGMSVEAASIDCEVKGTTFRGLSGDGIKINSGADSTIIGDNVFRNISGAGIRNAGTGTIWWKPFNHFDNMSLGNVIENTDHVYDGESLHKLILLTTEMTDPGNTVFGVTGMIGVTFPVPPDGTRAFRVKCRLAVNSNGAGTDALVELRLATTGLISDAVYESRNHIDMTAIDFRNLSPHGSTVVFETTAIGNHPSEELIVAPAANERITITVDLDSGATSDIRINGYANAGLIAQTFLSLEYLEQ